MNILRMSLPDRQKIMREITVRNRWFVLFAKTCVRAYHEQVASDLIKRAADDLRIFGFKHTKGTWTKFMEWHYEDKIKEVAAEASV